LNLETFRKNGLGVKTPVWFVQEGQKLYIWTGAASGKVKRVRNAGRVNIAPCQASGTPLGEWLPATARLDDSDSALKHVNALMRGKYGFVFSLLAFIARLRHAEYTAIQVEVA
jgi:uncharacterized protein